MVDVDTHPLFATPVAVPEDLAVRAKRQCWPEGLLQRALDLRVPRADIELWLTSGQPPPEEIARHLDNVQRLLEGPIRAREATWADAERLVDLYANAPEMVGDWEMTVERGPNPYAQFRLQEHVNMQVLECRGVLLAAKAHSTRNSLIGGERYAVHVMSAWRVRREFRGQGLSRLLQTTAGPGSAWFGIVTCWYERSGNASQGWLDKVRSEVEERGERRVGGLTATVHLLRPQAPPPLPAGLSVRPAEPADIPRCVELVNRTHAGLDLFRPYSVEFLEGRLDDPFWGPRPEWWPSVYGWGDYAAVEHSGEVVACGGLWDRGRDVREVWRQPATGEHHVPATTALLDWGHAAGREDAMAALVGHFLGRTADLGRTHLMAPLEFAPRLLAELGWLEPTTETRALRSMGFHEGSVHVDPPIERPYTDLAYW